MSALEITKDELKHLTDRVEILVRKAGGFISQERKNFDPARIESKGYNNLVSYVDKETEKILVKGLTEILPEAGFITEEDTSIVGKKEINWVIDPLDGTTNFLHNYPLYAVNVALMNNEEVFLGVTYDVVHDECFTAWRGGGSWLNGKQMQVSQRKHLRDALIVFGFPYDLENKEDAYFDMQKKLTKACHSIRNTGSAAIEMAWVACGRADAYLEANVYIWDIAPGIILVQEAGGYMSDFAGGNTFWSAREVLACGSCHAELVDFTKENW